MMPNARLATMADLGSLLALFAASDVSRSAEPRERAEQIWAETLARDGLVVFASNADTQIVSTCMLIAAPNLLRGGRQHGIIENVVTPSRLSGTWSRPRRYRCSAGRSVEARLPPRLASKRSGRTAHPSVLRRVRLCTRTSYGLRRAASRNTAIAKDESRGPVAGKD